MTTTINEQQAIQVLRTLAVENPGQTNNGVCRYVRYNDEGAHVPNCVVAHALTAWGVEVDVLAEHDLFDNSGFGEDEVLDALAETAGLTFTGEAIEILYEFQGKADRYGNGDVEWQDVWAKIKNDFCLNDDGSSI